MRKRLRVLPGLVCVLAGVFYLPFLSRAFVSEDLLILRRLHEATARGVGWSFLLEQFTGSWLGLTLVGFYRPLAHAVLQLEWLAFGPWPTGFAAAHLAIHLVNTLLVVRLVRRLLSLGGPAASSGLGAPTTSSNDGTAWFAAAVFALHPLHPNAVLFIASFATLTGTTWALICLNAALPDANGYSPTIVPRLRAALAAVACLLACLSYEQFVVLPVVAVALHLVCVAGSESNAPRPRWLNIVGRQAGLIVVPAVYVAWRREVLGAAIGGYGSFVSRLAEPWTLVRSAWTNWVHWWFPYFGDEAARWMTVVAAMLALAVLLLSGWSLWSLWSMGARRSPCRPQGLLVGVGAFWWLGVQAPFFWAGVVPANGRYLYFSTAGGALLCSALLHAVLGSTGTARRQPAARPTFWRSSLFRGTAATTSVLLLAVWSSQLYRFLRAHELASREVTTLRTEVMSWVRRQPAPMRQRAIVLVGAPSFIDVERVHVAQAYHWGLSDSFLAPWVDTDPLDVLVAPPVGDLALARLAGPESEVSVLRWHDGQVQRVPLHSVPVLEVDRQPASPSTLGQVRREEGTVDRLVMVLRGTYVYQRLTVASEDGLQSVGCPDTVVHSMRTIFEGSGDAVGFWWVERRRASDGRLEALSPAAAVGDCRS